MGEDEMFNQKLSAVAQAVDQHLARHLDQACARAPDRLAGAMRYAVLGPGKRFRPFLVVETAALFDVPADRALHAAAAVELVHCYSLVHDDLPAMDDDDVRRGRPTVHIKFGEATAILVGDALLTLAFEVMAAQPTDPDPTVRAALCLDLAKAAGAAGMVGGQQLDLDAEHAHADIDRIRQIQSLKTGALIRHACAAGALLGRADALQAAALARYADAIGLAFQVSDDLLDVEGDAGAVGKRLAKDAAHGKATFVSLLGIDGARHQLRQLEQDAISALTAFAPRAGSLTEAARFIAKREK